MADRPGPPLALRATSGRDWRLVRVRALSSTAHLARDASAPASAAPALVLKSAPAASDAAVRALLDEAAAWRRAHAAEPDLVLPLLDVAVARPHVHFIAPLCRAGALADAVTAPRPERAALRLLALVAAAVDAAQAAAAPGAPRVHAAVSPDHVLLDHAAAPRLAGFGPARLARLRGSAPPPTERDDVVALAGLLHLLLFNAPFDPAHPALPDKPPVSLQTRALLSDALVDRSVALLSTFRYDLAAARRLVPVCGPPLAPVLDARRQALLDADLNSNRGVANGRPASTPAHTPSPARFETPHPGSGPRFTPKPRPVTARARTHEEGEPPARKAPLVAPPPTPVPPSWVAPPTVEAIAVEGPSSGGAAPVAPSAASAKPGEITGQSEMDEAIRSITTSALTTPDPAVFDALVRAVGPDDVAVSDHVYKTLFRLPISKSPVVALKAAALVHQLVANGPALFTSVSLSKDGFLSWIESNWTPDRIQNRPGKPNMYTYCFATGEVATYVSMLRKRISTHAKFSEVVTTHWFIRGASAGSTPSIEDTKRREIVRAILEVIEKSGALLRKILRAQDPTKEVKTGIVPLIILDMAKAYLVLCWVVGTANEQQRRDMRDEFSVAHNATRGAMVSLQSSPSVSQSCEPLSILELDEVAPQQFDPAQILATLKRIKRKQKRRGEKQEPAQKDVSEDSPPKPYESATTRDPPSEVTVRESSPQRQRPGPAEHQPSRRTSHSSVRDEPIIPPPQVSIQNGHIPESQSSAYTAKPKSVASIPTNGLRKLSLSVRKDQNGIPQPSRFAPPQGDPHKMNGHHHSLNGHGHIEQNGTSKMLHHRYQQQGHSEGGRMRHQNGRRREEMSSEESSESTSEEESPRQRRNGASSKSKRGKREEREARRRAARQNSSSESESESDSSSDDSDSVKRKRKSKTNGKRHGNAHENGHDVDGKGNGQQKKGSRKQSDEKQVPFENGNRKGASKKKQKNLQEFEQDENSGGSKEALAAAAQGRKTPKMNSAHEVAPYEVHFGPQVGSGGFGVVYKAKFRDETVAVKKIHAHALSNAQSVTEFQSEVAVLCTLHHANILRFVGACTKPPNLMIITEFMANGTLFDLLHQTQERVTWAMRKKFALDTCKGMRYLHDSKLLHRDLKSSNLMLDKEFNCKVGDFGLTRISKGAAAVQMTGQCGTFQYMAVEVLASKPYSEKADVFSFGILLWEMVVRKLPYFGMQPMQVGIAVVQQGLRPTIPPTCPAPLARLMRSCWDNDPNRRPSFAELVTSLEAMPEGGG